MKLFQRNRQPKFHNFSKTEQANARKALLRAGNNIACPERPKIGSKMETWWSSRLPGGKTTVLKVEKYTGLFPQWYTWVVRLSSDTPRGWTEMAI